MSPEGHRRCIRSLNNVDFCRDSAVIVQALTALAAPEVPSPVRRCNCHTEAPISNKSLNDSLCISLFNFWEILF